MCVGLQMQLKFYLTYILLTFSTILAEDIYSRQSNSNQRQTGVPKFESSKYADMLDENFEDDIEYIDDTAKSKTVRVTQISDSEPELEKLIENKSNTMKDMNSDLLNDLIINSDQKDKEMKVKNKDDLQEWLNAPVPNNEDTDVFDDIEEKFSFDDMGSDLRGYELYHGVSDGNKQNDEWKNFHGKEKKKAGTPRYPPVNKDKLYEVGLLAYMRDFHLGMIL